MISGKGCRRTILTAVFGLIAALMLALALVGAEPLISGLTDRLAPWLGAGSEPPDHGHALINAVISALVVLYAIAGAHALSDGAAQYRGRGARIPRRAGALRARRAAAGARLRSGERRAGRRGGGAAAGSTSSDGWRSPRTRRG